MRKILSLAVLTLLIWNQSSFAESNWFKQQSPSVQPAEPIEPKEDKPNKGFPMPEVPEPKVGEEKPIPKTVDPNTQQSPAVLLKQPCDRADKMFEVLKKYEEFLLFTGEGMTFGLQGNPYRGAMMFFTNQDTGSWTILSIYKDGMACMLSNGKNFAPYSGQQPDYGGKQ